jgi:choline monooxygenase
VDQQIGRASTLSSSAYFDPAVLTREKKEVFGRTWNLVGHLEQVAAPGDYFTASVGDEQIVVVRGGDERLRAFSNVCRHRAGPVAAGEGNRKSLQCGYHGWSYSLDGRLLTTPEFDGVECFTREEVCLPGFSVDVWESLVFVNLDRDPIPLMETLEDLPARVKHGQLAKMKLAARKEWRVECNWKTYVDNYLEGYHIPIVHPSLNKELDYPNYRVETRRYYSIQHSPIKRRADQRINLTGTAADEDAQFFWIFPNLMLNFYPDNYSTNLIIPLGPEQTLTVFEWFTMDQNSEASRERLRRSIEFSDEIQLEDIAICEAVQRGLRSATYDRGRYSVKRENGVHHFHRLLSECYARG